MADVAYIGPGGREPRPRRAPKPLLRALLGDILRRRRLDQDRTLSDVSRAARISMSYLSELERGRKEGSSEVLAAVCDALQIELADVLTEVGLRLARAGTVRRPLAVPSAGYWQQAQHPGPARGGDVRCLAA